MANMCFNNLNITGPKADVQRFLASVKTEETQFDFNGVVPMPEELRNTESPNATLESNDSNESIEKCGANNWHTWAIENWGTKWNPSCIDDWEIDESEEEMDIRIYFETPWSPPTEFVINASKAYPSLSFGNEFYEQGCEVIGEHLIQNGEFKWRKEPEWDSKEGIELRKDFGIYDLEEE
jgi:hypothetical protein